MAEPPPLPDTAFEIPTEPQTPSTASVCLPEPSGETGPHPAGPDPSPSGKAGRNLLFDEIARGGMGAVLRGRDPDLGRELAVKVLLEAHHGDPELVRRFLEEAQIAGQLQHPGVVPVYELGRFPDDRPFFTMKLVKGQTLATLLNQRTTPQDDLPRLLTIFEQVCQTVAYAHARGVIHRDLKPANVMVGSFGEVQVMDWGVAKVLPRPAVPDKTPPPEEGPTVIRTARAGSGSDVSRAGTVMGTPAFMPPEQAKGEIGKLDERADVFGLGAILCVILTGSPPYRSSDRDWVGDLAARGDLADACARLDGCGADAELVRLCKECLAAERPDRPRNAGEVAKRLAAYQAGVRERLRTAELERAAAQARAAGERKRRKLAMGLAASVLALVALAGGGGLLLQRQEAQRQADRAREEAALRQRVELALEKAAGLRDRERWGEAREVLEQAAGWLGEDGPADLRQRVEPARAEVVLVARLEGIRLKQVTVVEGYRFATRNSSKEYAEAIKDAGLAVEGEDPAEAAGRVNATGIRGQLVGALDDWARVEKEESRRAWLLEVLRVADPDPWRNRFRDPAVWKDRSALKQLAAEVEVAKLSPQMAVAFGRALQKVGADPAPFLLSVQRFHPNDFWINLQLGNALCKVKPDVAIGYYRAALAIRPGTAVLYNNIGMTHLVALRIDDAIVELNEAVALDARFAHPHSHLGTAYKAKGLREQSLAEYLKAVELAPGDPQGHTVLAGALLERGKDEEAMAEYRKAIELDPEYAVAHGLLGEVMLQKARFAEAKESLSTCLRFLPDNHPLRQHFTQQLRQCEIQAHYNLAFALAGKGQWDEAITEYRAALELDPKNAKARVNLGLALERKGEWDEAIREYRTALALDPKVAEAHATLGYALLQQGRFADAKAATHQCLDLLPEGDPLRKPTAQQLQRCERLLALDAKLPAILEGKDKPADNAERLALARLCQEPFKKLYAASARFYAEAFADKPELAKNPSNGHRYNAACAAALVGCGHGKDAAKLDEKERVLLRQQALDWLKADLVLWSKQADDENPKAREAVQQQMKHWQTDPDLAGVRDKDALDKLPEAERDAWRKLWDDVAAVLAKAGDAK
jgi:eukaryotic-like serine/threonine-protein kinase